MKKFIFLSLLALGLATPMTRADEAVRAAQAALQQSGYYSGTVDGELNADTRAALRRYQLRNQLEPSGELTPETAAALQRESGGSAVAQPAPVAPPPAAPVAPVAPAAPVAPSAPVAPLPGNDPRYAGLFARTPYENAPVEEQAATVRKAQGVLLDSRLYRGPVDGLPNRAFEDALLRYQKIRELPRTGRLDIDTLASMRLLPVAKIRRPRVEPAPYVPRPPVAPRGIPLD